MRSKSAAAVLETSLQILPTDSAEQLSAKVSRCRRLYAGTALMRLNAMGRVCVCGLCGQVMQLKEQYNKLRQESARKEQERAALTGRQEALAAEVAQAIL